MVSVRKVISNEFEINNAKHYNQMIRTEYPDQFSRPPLMVIPRPIYNEFEYCFKTSYVNSFYIEKANKNDFENDIICNILYDGIVRLKYNPAIEATLNAIFRD